MRFEWDEAKRKANIAKRGIDFLDVPEMFGSLMLVGTDSRKDYGEVKKIGFGFIRGRLMAVAFTERVPNSIRIISARNRTHVKKPPTKKRLRTNWGKIDALKDSEIDFSDIPGLGKTFFKRAVLRLPESKTTVTIRLDRQVLNWFKAKGPGYQTRINALLRAYMDAHKG